MDKNFTRPKSSLDARVYITTTIPYVNAEPHIGHALEFAQADVLARSRRTAGERVYFLSGTDENATKNVQAAKKIGISPRELVDKNSALFQKLLAGLNISNDQFIRTTEERHKTGAQALWRATDPADIYKKKYRGLYCVGCEQFYKPEELDENGECPEHPGRKPEAVEEENYFFRLSKYGPWLREILKSGELKIIPDFRKNELLAFIDRGLEDFSISRPARRTQRWGVPVPDDPEQTIYVWYDALANYITALGYPDAGAEFYKNFWGDPGARLHVLGKGVSRFHALYWPAMLKSAGLPLPTAEFIHGYITINGKKISKTVGNVVDPLAVIEKYGADAVRYFLLREIPAFDDGDWSEEKFIKRYNADLANGLGNFAARVLTLASARTNTDWTRTGAEVDAGVEKKIQNTRNIVSDKLEEFRFNEALAAIWDLIAFGDNYVNETKPWDLLKAKSYNLKPIYNLVAILDNVAALLRPFLPETAEKITACIVWENGVLQTKKPGILFPRLH